MIIIGILYIETIMYTGYPLHSNPHATWRHITGDQLKKAAEKLKKPIHDVKGEILFLSVTYEAMDSI